MAVETVGNLPPEADKLRGDVERQLPDILESFNRILKSEYGLNGLRVGGFTIVPEEAAAVGISCDEVACSIDERR